MPVPTSVADLDIVASNNSPQGSDSIGVSLDDYLRSHAAIIKQESEARAADISALSALIVGRNLLINGNFNINQRGYVSGAAVGANLYGHDRWKQAASADTYTFSTTANKTTVTIPAGKVLRQVIEGLNLQTGTYTLSWEGTAQGKIGAGSLSASGVTGSITGGTNTTIEFGPGTVANAQLEFGTIATPFENRHIGTEIALCQRYYWRINGQGNYGIGQAVSSTSVYGSHKFPVQMRTAPSSIDAIYIICTSVAGIAFLASSATLANATDQCANVSYINTGAPFVAGNASLVAGDQAGSYLGFSAEL